MSSVKEIEKQTAVVALANKIMKGTQVSEHMACLYWADATARAMRQHGYEDAMIQAGTASWKIVPDELDDGVSPNRFTYLFEAKKWRNPFNLFQVLQKNHLPEMHCWAGCPRSQLVVDLSLVFQPQQCLETTGMKWQTEHPSFFWGTADDAAELDYVYMPDVTACRLAASLLESSRNGVLALTLEPPFENEEKDDA